MVTPDPSTQQNRAAWRRSLRETPLRFGPVPDRIEITATFECVCDGGCPAVCWRCIACSPREPATVPDEVIEAVSERIGGAAGLLSPPAVTGTAPDPEDPETWAFPGPEDYSGTMPKLPPVDPESAVEGEE